MAFVEVERQKKGRTGYPAAFTPAKAGPGRLRINAEALEYLERRGKPWRWGTG